MKTVLTVADQIRAEGGYYTTYSEHHHVQLRTSDIDRCTATYSEHRSMYSYVRLSIIDVQ